MTEDVGALLPRESAHGLAVRETLTLVCRTVGRVGEAAPLTPLVHPGDVSVGLGGQADVGRHHQASLLLAVLAVQTEGSRWVGAHYGVYLDISAVPEHLLVPAPHTLRPVLALAPGVAGEVGPLHDTLTAGQTVGQHHLTVHSQHYVVQCPLASQN